MTKQDVVHYLEQAQLSLEKASTEALENKLELTANDIYFLINRIIYLKGRIK